jgi:hypothetical protein
MDYSPHKTKTQIFRTFAQVPLERRIDVPGE